MSNHAEFDAAFIEQFDRLYDQYVDERFRRALSNLVEALTALLNGSFTISQRGRLRVEPGRIKSPNRLLLKAQTQKYRQHIRAPEDIFAAIRDIAGTRVTCNTVADVYAVVDAIKSCATSCDSNRTLCKLHDDWEDDYIRDPKDSGYRAINLIVGVPVPRGGVFEPVACEIQVRTLLQHAWGELTHEDTYKPGVKVPELVRILSKRLATALAVLDEIAQDLRGELDRVEGPDSQAARSAEIVPPAGVVVGGQAPASEVPQAAEAAVGLVPAIEPPPLGSVEQTTGTSREDLDVAYQGIFGRNPSLTQDRASAIIARLQSAGLLRREQIAAMLSASGDAVKELESQYDKARLTDFGRLMAAIRLHEDINGGRAWIAEVLEKASARVAVEENAKQTFKAAYPDGKEAFGTVVFASTDYALVQLPEGDTGILHYSQMKTHPDEFVRVSERVREGDTLRVRILKTDADTRRIELQVIK